MTALEQYERLEAVGQWRLGSEAWQEVLVSFGNASLVLADFNEAPLAHWALAGVAVIERTPEGVRYAPDGAADEALLIQDAAMIEAIAAVTAMARTAPPAPARRRWPWAVALAACALALLAAFALPDLLRARAFALIPEERARLVGDRLETGFSECRYGPGRAALEALLARAGLAGRRVVVVRAEAPAFARLPGGTLLLSRALLRDSADAATFAGWLTLAAQLSAEDTVLKRYIEAMTVPGAAGFLISGEIDGQARAAMATALREGTPPLPRHAVARALAQLRDAGIQDAGLRRALSRQYPDLASAGPATPAQQRPVLGDQAWIALSAICTR
ncbi:MAG: hypothetical protein AAF281_09760 [Pseudomonadota bacterium]